MKIVFMVFLACYVMHFFMNLFSFWFLPCTDADYDKCMTQSGGALTAVPPPFDQRVPQIAEQDSQILTVGKEHLAGFVYKFDW